MNNNDNVMEAHSFAPQIHFIGCGGAGMAPLANIMLQQGAQVSGSDLQTNAKTIALAAAGATIFTGHNAINIPVDKNTLVVYSSAVGNDNPELAQAKKQGLRCLRRGAMLAEVAASYKRSVAIGGSHGKTTVTAMLVHIMRSCNTDCGFMIGGKVNGWNSESAAGNGDIFITEVDESDGTIALISPWLGLITNIEDDHSWSVGGREVLMANFRQFAEQSNHLIRFDDKATEELLQRTTNGLVIDSNVALQQYQLPPEWGEYQCLNGILAIQAAVYLGIAAVDAQNALFSFPGVARRMVCWLESDDLTIIEDYAHHPTEVAAVLKSLRSRFPRHHLRVVFQPHRYARLERYIDEFAAELSLADSILITPVFAAWTETRQVESTDLVQLIGEKACCINGSWSQMAETAKEYTGIKPLLIAVLGAGDIEQIIPDLIKRN
jgi:UDP-N-acetylmuramate--alanine ligase